MPTFRVKRGVYTHVRDFLLETLIAALPKTLLFHSRKCMLDQKLVDQKIGILGEKKVL